MAANVITKFLDSATVQIWAYIYTQADALVAPTAIVVSIWDPDGTLKADAVAMTPSGTTGIYYYNYHPGTTSDAMASGHWRGVVKVTDGVTTTAIITPISFGFEVA